MADDQRKEKAGSPLFGQLHTCKGAFASRKGGRLVAQPHADLQTPRSPWPQDTVIDPRHWAYWRMDGRAFVQTGKVRTCHSRSIGALWHQKDLRAHLQLSAAPRGPRKDPALKPAGKEEYEKRMRYVTDDDAVPNWPEAGWLPEDWRIGMRALPSGLMIIFVPPNQEEGFFFHGSQVLEYLSGGNPFYHQGRALQSAEQEKEVQSHQCIFGRLLGSERLFDSEAANLREGAKVLWGRWQEAGCSLSRD